MVRAVVPTYPLYPITCIVTAALLLVMLITNMVRHSWNFGVTLLTFSLFWELLTIGVNAIVWSDNADMKAYVYCDIVSHLQIFVSIVKPACTLIITRRLYRIASMRSVEPQRRREKIFDIIFNWTIGIGLPTLVTGVLYYIDQGARFAVQEGIGCTNVPEGTGVDLLLLNSWPVILPLISTLFYCRELPLLPSLPEFERVAKILYVFYRHDRETNEFLQSNSSIARNHYMRILAIGCLDIVLTLPLSIFQVIIIIANASKSLPFYYGWNTVHADWEPQAVTYGELTELGTWAVVEQYFMQWTSPVLAIAVFLLFGLTSEARAAYWQSIVTIGKFFGMTLRSRHHEPKELSQIQSEQRAVDHSDSGSSVKDKGDVSLAVDKVHGADLMRTSALTNP